MENYYSVLGVSKNSSLQEIKRAFREKAKKEHPDLVSPAPGAPSGGGKDREAGMRRLLTAYEVLSNSGRRLEYDRAYGRFVKTYTFDYREFLKERRDDPESQAKLIFFDLLHLEEDEALAVWDALGGLGFALKNYLDREDWMDCAFIMAEELEKRGRYYDAFILAADLVREERRRPYFRHFMEEVEGFLKKLVRFKLHSSIDTETYAECMEILLGLGFPRPDEARWMRSLALALEKMGEFQAARTVLTDALQKDPRLAYTAQLKKRLKIGTFDDTTKKRGTN